MLAVVLVAGLVLSGVALWIGSEALGLPAWLTDTVLLSLAAGGGIGLVLLLDSSARRGGGKTDSGARSKARRRRDGSGWANGADGHNQ